VATLLDTLERRVGRGDPRRVDTDHAAFDQVRDPVGLAPVLGKDEGPSPKGRRLA
jgi:hypothetical protein